jgi:ankyrin repeat protein
MPANLIITLDATKYAEATDPRDGYYQLMKNGPLFVFVDATRTVEVHGEFREIGDTEPGRYIARKIGVTTKDPEGMVERFGTPAYKAVFAQRRTAARQALANVAPPNPQGQPPAPPAGLAGLGAAEAAQQAMANSGGMVLGYEHNDQLTKDMMTETILKSGGATLKHMFIEEFSSTLQGDIDAFLADKAAQVSPALAGRISALRADKKVDFEPILYAARDKGVRLWGIDSPAADPGVPSDDPRYHERRLALMNAEAKRVFDDVRQRFPGEAFMACTGGQHLNTAEGGVPGLAQIMGAPGFSFDKKTKNLAFQPEDRSRRASHTALEKDCIEAILARAGKDWVTFCVSYETTPAYTGVNPKPVLNKSLSQHECTAEVQRLVGTFTADGTLATAANIPGLAASGPVGALLMRLFNATILRTERCKAVDAAIKGGNLSAVQAAVDADPYLLKMPNPLVVKTPGGQTGPEGSLLHVASEAGAAPIVQELIGRGMNPNAVDDAGKTPLHRALAPRPNGPSANGLGNVADRLLANGADATRADPAGNTGLSLARSVPEVMDKMVLRNQAPMSELFVSQFVAAASRAYAAAKVQTDPAFDEEEARQRAAALVASLPQNGVPLGTKVEVATAVASNDATTAITRLIAVWKARPQARQNAVTAIKGKDIDGLRTLLDGDPRLATIALEEDMMALGIAAVHGDTAAMDELVNVRRVPVDQKSPKGRTALHEVLGQEIDKTDLAKQTTAAQGVTALISRGADVNARNGLGQTALHQAAFANNIPAMQAIATLNGTNRAADVGARDARGWTPADTAMAATNVEAEGAMVNDFNVASTPPLKAGTMSTVDILAQATMSQDIKDSPKARQFIEQLYANEALRPMLDLAAAAACNDRDPPNGGLRLFASKTNTVGLLYSVAKKVGPTAAYDEKSNTVLFPLQDDLGDGKDGKAVGSLAHELTHLTAHLVTDDPDTLPFTDDREKTLYLAAIKGDVTRMHLLDDSDPVQKYIKDRFSGRMDDYEKDTGAHTDKALMQEYIVGVAQVGAVHGMDVARQYAPGLTDYYENVWTPKVQSKLATDARFTAGRAKIDTAANAKLAASLEANPRRQPEKRQPVTVQPGAPQLGAAELMKKIKADYQIGKGTPAVGGAGERSIAYKLDDFVLDATETAAFEKKRKTIEAALATLTKPGVLPAEFPLDELQSLVQMVSKTAQTYPDNDLAAGLKGCMGNWIKRAQTAAVEMRIERDTWPRPTAEELARTIVYNAEIVARDPLNVAPDPEMEVKEAKQKKLIADLTERLNQPGHAAALGNPAALIESMTKALTKDQDIVYQKPNRKPKEAAHVSIDVKLAKTRMSDPQFWVARLNEIANA